MQPSIGESACVHNWLFALEREYETGRKKERMTNRSRKNGKDTEAEKRRRKARNNEKK